MADINEPPSLTVPFAMRPAFSIVTTVYEPFPLLPRLLSCVARQEHPRWELLLVVDGPSPAGTWNPAALVREFRRHVPGRRVELWQLPRAPGCYGNVGRNFALGHARGEYVCWVNHDNLIDRDYLSAHAENVRRTPGCLSVVDVELWEGPRWRGRFPQALARSRIDLLCFAVPLHAARTVNAFGGDAAGVYGADWLVFDACRRLLPVEHNRKVVGTHF